MSASSSSSSSSPKNNKQSTNSSSPFRNNNNNANRSGNNSNNSSGTNSPTNLTKKTRRRNKKSTTTNNNNKQRQQQQRSLQHPLADPYTFQQQKEYVISNQLNEVLQQNFLTESAGRSENRKQAVRDLNLVLQQWAEQQQQQQGTTPTTTTTTKSSQAEKDNGASASAAGTSTTTTSASPSVALVCMGSYRLCVHTPSSDIDCICVAPPTLTRGDFFTSLVSRLQSDHRFQHVHPIPTAYTPVLKFQLRGLAIDLLFCRLSSSEKLEQHFNKLRQQGAGDEELQLSVHDLIGLDEQSIRSLNGARVAQFLLDAVPNMDNYRTTLRAVKYWATTKGLYSNVLGFLGGVNWAILVAWVCKRFPNAKPPTLLKAFFYTYGRWHWPSPVTLLDTQEQPPAGVLPLPVWSAHNPRDSSHLMPILTPTYPSMNSSYNVGIPQRRRLIWELQTAYNQLSFIESGSQPLDALFRRDFFRQHFHFLVLHIMAPNASLFVEWYRYCESRLRLLISGLEASPGSGVQAWPYAKLFRIQHDARGRFLGVGDDGNGDPNAPQEATFFLGLRIQFQNHFQTQVDLRPSTLEFLNAVNSWDSRQRGMDLTMELLTQEELPAYVFRDDDDNYRNTNGDALPQYSNNETDAQPQEPRCSDTLTTTPLPQPQEPEYYDEKSEIDECDNEPSTGGSPGREVGGTGQEVSADLTGTKRRLQTA